MATRFDRLVLLLDTGTTASVRSTAAQQIGEIQKQHPGELTNLLSRVLVHLRSKRWDTRIAAGQAFAAVAANVPHWNPSSSSVEEDEKDAETKTKTKTKTKTESESKIKAEFDDDVKVKSEIEDEDEEEDGKAAVSNQQGYLSFEALDIQAVLTHGTELLGSVGKEYDVDWGNLSAEERLRQQRKNLKSRLGIGSQFIEDDFMNDLDAPMTTAKSGNEPATPSTPVVSKETLEINENLSARERNRLKRKAKQEAKEKKSKIQVMDLSARRGVVATDKHSPAAAQKVESTSPYKDKSSFSISEQPCSDKLVVESNIPSSTSEADVEWPFEAVCEVLCMDLFDPAWEIRHGAGIGLREILKTHGSGAGRIVGVSAAENEKRHAAWLTDCAVRLLCVFALDRFGDFVSDQVVAPVRETCAQTSGALLRHMPDDMVMQMHHVLLELIMQENVFVDVEKKRKSKQANSDRRMWEVRHAGLLGLKYAVAVRGDLVERMLDGTIDAVILGLQDQDDDVRAVAASTLLPIAESFVSLLPNRIPKMVAVLWDCLQDLKDDLTASTATVMDLLAKLFSMPSVLQYVQSASTKNKKHSLQNLVPRLYPFFRHTITSVRVAVLNTLLTFTDLNADVATAWVDEACLRLLLQNMLVEEKKQIFTLTLTVWTSLLKSSNAEEHRISNFIDRHLKSSFTLLMTPLGTPLDASLFLSPTAVISSADRSRKQSSGERISGDSDFVGHNLDVGMITQDFALVTPETVIRGRLAAATAIGRLMSVDGREADFETFLNDYLDSAWALKRQLSGIIIEEWAIAKNSRVDRKDDTSEMADKLAEKCNSLLEAGGGPAQFLELNAILQRIRAECQGLFNAFSNAGGFAPNLLPDLPALSDSKSSSSSTVPHFNIDHATTIATVEFSKLLAAVTPKKKRTSVTPGLEERNRRVLASIGYYNATNAKADVGILASIAGAVVAMGALPNKLNPVIRAIMNSVKYEENLDLQQRAGTTLTHLIDLCASGRSRTNPSDKIVKNLCTFLCADPSVTPVLETNKVEEEILSLDSLASGDTVSANQASISAVAAAAAIADSDLRNIEISPPQDESPAVREARLVRRGAHLALSTMADKFGKDIFEKLPVLWECMDGILAKVFDGDRPDEILCAEDGPGQQIVDALQIVGALATSIHSDQHSKMAGLLPNISKALRVRYAVIRNMASRTLATLCNVIPLAAMDVVVREVVSHLGDVKSVVHRQGALEAVYHIVMKMDTDILPYVIFLIVPILGRMSDSNDSIRTTATNCFATLIKLVPLEAGIPDPPGVDPKLLEQRNTERKFLAQLMDSKKLEPFKIPVKINADLRKYQQEGVNWMAFLNKYQLHGILCDDMGLGKTLQSICMLASDHHLRAVKFKDTRSPDASPLPSIVICPPTLTGHWQHEIEHYAGNLKSLCYTGGPAERRALRSKIPKHDIIIASYEIIRNDIEDLGKVDWNYCILDEGHVIKNGKTKITKAVKSLRALHRLILSGTPVQNNVLELWSLFDFLMPGFLGTEKMFNEKFSKPILASRDSKSSSKDQQAGALALEALHKQALPFLLRRLKEDVLSDLPPKIIQDCHCELSIVQKQLYDTFARSNAKEAINGELTNVEDFEDDSAVEGKSKSKKATHIFQALQYLRKLCNHPLLVLNPKHPEYTRVMCQINAEGGNLHDLAYAPKLNALKQLLLDCGIGTSDAPGKGTSDSDVTLAGTVSQHRVLIFCQLKTMLDIIEQDLFKRHMPGVTYMRLDGGVDLTKRHGIVQKFNSDPSIDVLLLTTHVGGLGLNLTGADTVIFFEHDWNPMKDLQAMDRAHRIGQKKVVNVYRLITKGTLEEKIMGLQKFKLNIANSIITQQNAGLQSMDTEQILDLLAVSTESASKGGNKHEGKDSLNKTSTKNVLENLQELWDEKQYEEEYNLDGFIDSLKK